MTDNKCKQTADIEDFISKRITDDILGGKGRKKHPSYGYATKEEVERLKVLTGPEKVRLLKEITKRTKHKGAKK